MHVCPCTDYKVQSDMRVDWCSAVDAAVPATARSAVGRTAVTSGPDDAMGNGLDEETGKEAEGFLTIVLPKLGGREVRGSKRSQGRDFTPERRSAHVVGFCPAPVTSWVVQWTWAMPLTMDQPKVGMKRGQRCRFSAAAVHAISSSAAAQAQPDAAHSKATCHLNPSSAGPSNCSV